MKAKYWIFVIAGMAAIIAGFCLAKVGEAASPVPYVMLGLGAGAMGHGAGFLLRQYAVRGCAEAEKRLRIEEQDERNQALNNRAKARAFDFAMYIYMALMLALAIMQISLTVTFVLLAGYLAINSVYLYYFYRYNKEM